MTAARGTRAAGMPATAELEDSQDSPFQTIRTGASRIGELLGDRDHLTYGDESREDARARTTLLEEFAADPHRFLAATHPRIDTLENLADRHSGYQARPRQIRGGWETLAANALWVMEQHTPTFTLLVVEPRWGSLRCVVEDAGEAGAVAELAETISAAICAACGAAGLSATRETLCPRCAQLEGEVLRSFQVLIHRARCLSCETEATQIAAGEETETVLGAGRDAPAAECECGQTQVGDRGGSAVRKSSGAGCEDTSVTVREAHPYDLAACGDDPEEAAGGYTITAGTRVLGWYGGGQVHIYEDRCAEARVEVGDLRAAAGTRWHLANVGISPPPPEAA